MEKAAAVSSSAAVSPSFVATAASTARSFSESPCRRMFRSSVLLSALSVRRYDTISASVMSSMLVAVESMAVRTPDATESSSFSSAARKAAT